MAPVSLDAFHRVLGAHDLPYAEVIRGCRCVFPDQVSAGRGGIDYRMQDEDRIEPALSWHAQPWRAADGSDRDRVGAWPERGILGTQLGPNRNGRRW